MRLLFLLTAFLGFVEGPDPSLVSDDLKQEERLGGTFDPFDDAETEQGDRDRAQIHFAIPAKQPMPSHAGERTKQSVLVWTTRRHSDLI